MKELMNNLILDRKKDTLSNDEISFLDTLSDDEINQLINECTKQYNYFNAVQTGQKLILNSIYGAFGNEFFVCSNTDIAGAITAMCRDLIKYMDITNETYWYDFWHVDTDLHELLNIETPKQIDPQWIHTETGTDYDGEVTQQDMEDGIYTRKYPVSCYVDTDSVDSKSILRTDKGIMTIEDLYKYSEKFGSNGTTLTGHESVKTDAKILNYSENNKLYYAPIKRIIKHKVNKPKYKLKTKSGKCVYVTSDHSLVVFRNNIQTIVKPNEIVSGDLVLSII